MGKKQVLEKAEEIVDAVRRQEPVRKHLSQLKRELPDVFQHSVHVAHLATALGILNELEKDQLRILALAGLLHDLGKLDIDDNILYKAGPLTEEEEKEIKKHPRKSLHRLKEDFFQEIRKLVVAHHENQTDPYPRLQQRDDEYQALTEIITAADMYTALASSREYKDSFGRQKIAEIMREEFTGSENLINQVLALGELG